MPDTPRRQSVRYAARLTLVVTAVAGPALVAGCGQPAPSNPDDTVAPTVSVPIQPTILPATSQTEPVSGTENSGTENPGPSASDTEAPFDPSQSLVTSTCAPTGDVWSFTGTVKNTDTAEHAFTVGVFVISKSDGSQLSEKEIVVRVAPGVTAPVEAKAFYAGPVSGAECVTGVTVKEDE